MADSSSSALRLRIVSLNLWGGQALGPLLDFVREGRVPVKVEVLEWGAGG